MADTAFFRPEVFVFLRQLKRHNDREWFAKNKARYQTSIVEPALSFISGFAPYLGRISPHFVADARPARGSLFRIYRDTRFSPDGHPFKTHVGIHFSHATGKDAHAPVFYPPLTRFLVLGLQGRCCMPDTSVALVNCASKTKRPTCTCRA